MRLALTLFLTLFSFQAANAQFESWMEKGYKQADPSELIYILAVGEACLITKAEGEAILESVFVRSRIKPLSPDDLTTQTLYLLAKVDCLHLANKNPVFTLDARFGSLESEFASVYVVNYGSHGVGSKELVKAELRETIERAITDYLKANFDLGDDE